MFPSGSESLAPRLKLMFPGASSRALTARALGVVTLGANLLQHSTTYRRSRRREGGGESIVEAFRCLTEQARN